MRGNQPRALHRHLCGSQADLTSCYRLTGTARRLAAYHSTPSRDRIGYGAFLQRTACRRSEICLQKALGAHRSKAEVGHTSEHGLKDLRMGAAFAGLTLIYGVLGDLVYLAPGKAGDLLFGLGPGEQDYLMDTIFRILAPMLELVAACNWFQKGAAEQGKLGIAMHVRNSAALGLFAISGLVLVLLGTWGEYSLRPAGGVIWASLSVCQLIVASQAFGRGSGKRGPLKVFYMMQSLFADLARLPQIDGLNSGLYSIFTSTFVGIGAAFIALPELTKTGMFGSTAMTAEDLLLWRQLGATVALIVGSVAFTQQEAAIQNNFSMRSKRLLMAGLALVSGTYVWTLLPMLFTERDGGLLLLAGLPWGTMCVASTLIAVKPKESEGWYTPW